MSNEGKRPIALDLVECYSGLQLDELEYIDYTRTTTGSDSDDGALGSDSLLGKSGIHRIDSIQENVEGERESECEFDEYHSIEDNQSYLCSTPTAGRKHRGRFSEEAEISGFNLECTKHYGSRNSDSGIRTRSFSRTNSIVSLYRGTGHDLGSIEELDSASSTHSHSPDMRRKIEVDSDVQDPYNVDDLELSIEEESATQGTFRRQLSLKILRQKPSLGLFGSYLRKSDSILPLVESSSSQQASSSKDEVPQFNSQKGPVNFWFRKFRNRHYI